jgi:hypothetical protein
LRSRATSQTRGNAYRRGSLRDPLSESVQSLRGCAVVVSIEFYSDARDAEIVTKEATRELTKLVKARLGLDLDAPIAKLRVITMRYVLAGEFRLDLCGDKPASPDSVAKPASKDHESAVSGLARRLLIPVMWAGVGAKRRWLFLKVVRLPT